MVLLLQAGIVLGILGTFCLIMTAVFFVGITVSLYVKSLKLKRRLIMLFLSALIVTLMFWAFLVLGSHTPN